MYHATIDFMCLSGMKKTELQSAIGCICVYDQFWFQADRYMKHIREKKEFSYYEEWKSISPVVYEIDQDSTGDVYIYRISL